MPAGCGWLWRRSSPLGDGERGPDAGSRRRVSRLQWPELHAREEGARGRQRRLLRVWRAGLVGRSSLFPNQPVVSRLCLVQEEQRGGAAGLCSHRERREKTEPVLSLRGGKDL
jgi:hypothetical protein